MAYVDGFMAAVPTDRKEAFIKHSKVSHDIMRENGAISIVDCWGDDVPEGKVTSMRKAVQAGENETVIFAWIIWPDKATRDAGMQAMMADSRMSEEQNPMPFDGQRIIFGGFEPVLQTP